MNNFLVLDSYYGKFIVGRHCHYQAEALVKTGFTHIEQELRNIFVLLATIPEHGLIVDAGANIGFFSIPVALQTKSKNIRVLAFEPQPQLYNALCGSVALNEMTDNVFVYNMGLGRHESVAAIDSVDYSKDADYGMVSLHEAPETEHPYMRRGTAKIVSLDSMKLPALDFLKVDVEGYEIDVLAGARESIRAYRPWIWIEYNIIGKDTIKEELSYLLDYDFVLVDWQNMVCVPKEKAEAADIRFNNAMHQS